MLHFFLIWKTAFQIIQGGSQARADFNLMNISEGSIYVQSVFFKLALWHDKNSQIGFDVKIWKFSFQVWNLSESLMFISCQPY